MKSFKQLEKRENMQELGYDDIEDFLYKRYPDRYFPFNDSLDIPNNWLRMHGYAMHRKLKK